MTSLKYHNFISPYATCHKTENHVVIQCFSESYLYNGIGYVSSILSILKKILSQK